jgi:hypothetical protein
MILPPPDLLDLQDIGTKDAFILRGGLVDAWFIRRSDVLLVTFDNLGSIGEFDPPQPWLHARVAKAGFSILGLIASRKDWYRNEDTPSIILRLRDAGLFESFRRVVFVGASMGGFAALVASTLVPGSIVLAFSPQSSLSRKLAPFEDRYRYAQRKWDWNSPYLLDAAAATEHAAEVYLVYDPFVPNDAAHARRIKGDQVQHLHANHMGHRAIRQIKAVGLLQALIEDVAAGTFDMAAWARGMRSRRDDIHWQRSLFAEAERRGHARLVLTAAKRIHQENPGNIFARRVIKRLTAASSAQVAIRAADNTTFVTTPPPAPPFTGAIQQLSGAFVVPERKADQALACGVLDAVGNWCPLSRGWIRAGKSYPQPKLGGGEEIVDLPGTHLYGGHFRGHFGHFLVEATARLWALDHVEKPDSIVYLPYRGQVEPIERAIKGLAPFFRLLNVSVPIHTYGKVMRAERLILPELGFGWAERFAGSPAYRAFMQKRLTAAASADGAEKLYISRSILNAHRGGILGETVIEDNLSRLGYEIFHPERHPLEVQIARYKAARRIVALDGSALHLAAYVLREDGRVAIIKRRSRANVADYVLQFKSFCNIDLDVVDAIRTDWIFGNATRSDYKSIGEIDFGAVFDTLKRKGYVPQGFVPDLPSSAEVHAMLQAYENKRDLPFRPLQPGERHPEEDD